jgi:exosome complex RNA-binding protein Csl4
MNIDEYLCECGHVTEFDKEYGKEFPKTIPCEKCGKTAKRKIGNKKIVIPDEMKSTFKPR